MMCEVRRVCHKLIMVLGDNKNLNIFLIIVSINLFEARTQKSVRKVVVKRSHADSSIKLFKLFFSLIKKYSQTLIIKKIFNNIPLHINLKFMFLGRANQFIVLAFQLKLFSPVIEKCVLKAFKILLYFWFFKLECLVH